MSPVTVIPADKVGIQGNFTDKAKETAALYADRSNALNDIANGGTIRPGFAYVEVFTLIEQMTRDKEVQHAVELNDLLEEIWRNAEAYKFVKLLEYTFETTPELLTRKMVMDVIDKIFPPAA